MLLVDESETGSLRPVDLENMSYVDLFAAVVVAQGNRIKDATGFPVLR